MQEFLLEYGLLAIFLCAIVENDVTFILTGVMVHLSPMHPVPAIVAGLAGALLHDSIWFGLGQWRSDTVRSHRVYRRVGPAVERLAARFGPWELFVCRFIYGTRTPSLVFWGVQRLSLTTFLLIETLALTLWATVLVALGYFLSSAAQLITTNGLAARGLLVCSACAASSLPVPLSPQTRTAVVAGATRSIK